MVDGRRLLLLLIVVVRRLCNCEILLPIYSRTVELELCSYDTVGTFVRKDVNVLYTVFKFDH